MRWLLLAGLGLLLAAAFVATASAQVVSDDFSTDPTLSPDWTMVRGTGATTGVLEWNGDQDALTLVRYDPTGGPWTGVAVSNHPLPSRHWRLTFDMKWEVGPGTHEGGVVVQFHRDMAAYASGVIACGYGFYAGTAAVVAVEGYGIDMSERSGCGHGTPPHAVHSTPHLGILEDDLSNHHADMVPDAHSDGDWHAMTVCFSDGVVTVGRDGAQLLQHAILGFDFTYDGWGLSAHTDSRATITADNVLLEDRAHLPEPASCPVKPCDPAPSACGTDGEPGDPDGCVPAGCVAPDHACPALRVDPPVTGFVMRTGQPITFRVVATEATPEEGFLLRLLDGHPHLPANVSFDTTTGAFSWTPGGEPQGADAFVLTFQAARPPGKAACERNVRISLWPTALAVDRDRDGIADPQDNCVNVPNRDQRDADRDEVGDACDEAVATTTAMPAPAARPRRADDADGDGVADVADTCPTVPDLAQADLDADGTGDACDLDADGDSVSDVGAFADNCPALANPGQEDRDGNEVGDACDEPAAAPSAAPAISTTAPGGPAAAAPLPALLAVLAGLLVAAAARRAS